MENETTCDRLPRELTGIHLVGYCMTSFGNIIPISLFNGFIFYYYIYVVGLDSLLVTSGIFLGLIINAIANPIMGVLSDNKKPTKLGKRKFFLLLGAPFELILSYIIWLPPMAPLNNPYSWPTALFFWITSMGFNFFYVVVGAPYGAMMPEQSETEKNRIKISAIQGIFNIVGSVLGIVLPILIQSTLPDPQQSMYNTPSGEKMTTLVPLLGLLFGIILVGCVIFTMFTVDESFFLKECEEPQEKRTIKSVLTQFAQPFKHDNTREFYWSTFASNMSMRILMTVLLPIATYVLILIGTEFLIFIAILVPITVVGFLIWTSIVGKLGTQRSYAYSLYGLAIPCFLSLFLLIPMSHTFTMVLGIALIGIALAMLVGQFLFTNPIMSSLVDEGQQRAEEFGFKPNTNLAGAYFGMWGFIINVASGLANMILGVIYTGNNKTDPFYLVISLPIAGFLILLTVYYLNNVRIRKKITQ